MNADRLFEALEGSGRAIDALMAAIPAAEARRQPAPGKWSMLEVLCHLIDEERDDFRLRVRLTLEDPSRDWPAIDPEGWARDRDYNQRDPAGMRAEFQRERAVSLAWLRGLQEPRWERTKVHPHLGALSAGDLLASWTAHDVLHLRQMAAVRLTHLEHTVAPYSTRYAQP